MTKTPDVPPNSRKSWRLVAPDWSSLDTIWRNPLPFVLWPVGNQPLLAHWMDAAVRSGVEDIEIFVADRPAEIRAWLEEGVYWSRTVEIVPINQETAAPADAQRMDCLPGTTAAFPQPMDAAELLRHWFDLQKAWLANRPPEVASLEQFDASGGWIGPQAIVHPSARLVAPFWIGPGARIGEGCTVGPNAFVAGGAILDQNVEVEEAFVAGGTYAGKNTRVAGAIACGNVLVDMSRATRVEIGEPFILAAVGDKLSRSNIAERLAALLCLVLLAPAAFFWNRGGWIEQHLIACEGEIINLRTGSHGPLWARRCLWLWHIVCGRLRWIGALPREAGDMQRLPPEMAQPFRRARAGMFSLADMHRCHSVADPEEWIHASYQVQRVNPNITALVLKNLWRIAWS